jgi:hypothetical protein
MHSKNLGAFLGQADGINSLMPQAKRLLELRQVLSETLPQPLAKHTTIANYRQGKLIIYAANAAVAAKLKLLRQTLSNRFLERGLQITAMEIEVQPSLTPQPRPAKAAVLSDQAREALAKLSTQLTESELKYSIAAMAKQDVGKR